MRRLLRQPAAQTMMLDGSQYDTFVINFNTSVLSLRLKRISPGQLYVFVLMQGPLGYHELVWGERIRNAISLNPKPNAITVQCFIGITGGFLQAIPPGTWIEESTP